MKFKKGTYYVGDPCYIFDESWDKILNDTEYFEKPLIINNEIGIAGSTAHGDGCYTDNHGKSYIVDAGLIGVMPISFLNVDNELTIKQIGKYHGMHIVKFDDDFDVEIYNGEFIFGNIVINTKEEYEDD